MVSSGTTFKCFVKTISFRSEPFINPLYYGFLSNEIWASLWSWIFSKLDKVFIININSKHHIYFKILDSAVSCFKQLKEKIISL